MRKQRDLCFTEAAGIEIKLSPDEVAYNQERARALGRLQGSVLQGRGNAIGFVGQYAAAKFLNVPERNSADFDLVYRHLRLEVKSRSCTSKPLGYYRAGDFNHVPLQACDAYLFTRVLAPQKETVWLLGWLTKSEFLRQAQAWKKGEVDPGGDGLFCFAEDSLVIEISKLWPMADLIQLLWGNIKRECQQLTPTDRH
jgi:DNA primase